MAFYKLQPVALSWNSSSPPTCAREGVPLQLGPCKYHSFCSFSRGSWYFPRASFQARKMLQCLTSEGEERTDSKERETRSIEDIKEIITLAFVRENTQKGFQDAHQQSKKKRKKKRLGLKDGEWESMLEAQEGPEGKEAC